MKSKLAIAFAAAALLTTGVAQASADLADKGGCNKCHAVDANKMGPSYKDIAAKTKSMADADIVKKLATGKGNAGKDEKIAAVLSRWQHRCETDDEDCRPEIPRCR